MLQAYYDFLAKYKNHENTLIKDLVRTLAEINGDLSTLEAQVGSPVSGTGSLNSGVNYSLPADHNPEFMVLASAIVRPSNGYSYGAPITWTVLDHTDGHGSSFFTSAEGIANTRLKINYPSVRKVFNVSITPDETFAANGTIVGPTVNFDNFEAAVVRMQSLPGISLLGNANGVWTKSGKKTGSWDVTAYSSGSALNVVSEAFAVDYDGFYAVYMGTNNYRVRLRTSGLGAYNVGFVLVDNATNLDVASITSADIVKIGMQGAMSPLNIPMNQWATSDESNTFMGTFTNFWVLGLFEAWMVANRKSATAITVKWQTNYPSATNYKIYRDTNADFSTQTLIHTGTSGTFEDTGLTASTLYHYKLVAVVSGVDTEVTTFRCKTAA